MASGFGSPNTYGSAKGGGVHGAPGGAPGAHSDGRVAPVTTPGTRGTNPGAK